MRITRETLLKLARDTVTQRARADRGIVSAYLHGSLLEEEPLLGGTADIDLFIVHNDSSQVEREIVRITDEVILDITHHPRNVYRQTKELRLHPWLGPTIFGCKILYDPQHFMDFTQAGVRGQFNRADQVLGRARPQVEHARQMWMDFDTNPPAPGLEFRPVIPAHYGTCGQRGRAGQRRSVDRAAIAVEIPRTSQSCQTPWSSPRLAGAARRSRGKCRNAKILAA